MNDGGTNGTFATGPLLLRDAALFLDLYELTMAAVYFRRGMHADATFSLFTRKLPARRGFLVAAGVADAIAYLESLRFSEDALSHLRTLDMFDAEFLDFLRGVRFTGDVRAVREGTVLFADEPILEVTAPIIEAQLVETALLNLVHLPTTLASKAARVVLAAQGRAVVEFGFRRAQGIDAGMKAARCAYLAGAVATSNVLAGLSDGIPPNGTMAHSYVLAFPQEIEAFRAFAQVFPRSTTLLLDTYDTLAAAHAAVEVATEMSERGEKLSAVRLDSGDLERLSRGVRAILDEAGLHDVHIVASGGLDEDDIARLVARGAPIDAFGVGTRMATSADAPYLDMAYKLVRVEGRDVLKLSEGKETWVGEKQVYRLRDADGTFAGDVIGARDEAPPAKGAEGLLSEVMRGGRVVSPVADLGDAREHCRGQIEALPEAVRRLSGWAPYPVRFSAELSARQAARRSEARERLDIASADR